MKDEINSTPSLESFVSQIKRVEQDEKQEDADLVEIVKSRQGQLEILVNIDDL